MMSAKNKAGSKFNQFSVDLMHVIQEYIDQMCVGQKLRFI